MMNSFDLRNVAQSGLDPYGLLAQHKLYTARQFQPTMYYPPNPIYSNNAKPPGYGLNSYYIPEMAGQWLMGHYPMGVSNPAPQLVDYSQQNFSAPMINHQPMASSVTEPIKPEEKVDGTTMEEEVQIIEVKERCFNKFCADKKKQTATRDMKKVQINGVPRTLCKKCCSAFENKQFCPFCYEIYLDASTQNDSKIWVQCERKGCTKWVHLECEEEGIRGPLKEQHTRVGNIDAIKYFCPECRDQHKLTIIFPSTNKKQSSKPTNTTVVSTDSRRPSPKLQRRSSFLARKKTANGIAKEKQLHPNEKKQLHGNSRNNHVHNVKPPKVNQISPPQQVTSRGGANKKIVYTPYQNTYIIEGLLSTFGVRPQLSDYEITRDLIKMRAIPSVKPKSSLNDVKKNNSDFIVIEDQRNGFSHMAATSSANVALHSQSHSGNHNDSSEDNFNENTRSSGRMLTRAQQRVSARDTKEK